MDRVLVVDDDESILFALRRIVSRRGWEPLVARSGAEALGLVDRADAVVTDLCMPGMNGLELIRALRQRDEALPVILVTAQDNFAVEAKRAGAYDYLTKPFDVDTLAMALDRALEARRLRVENRQLKEAGAPIERAAGAGRRA
jgi:two-component system, NtrC family, response regulator AtoC